MEAQQIALCHSVCGCHYVPLQLFAAGSSVIFVSGHYRIQKWGVKQDTGIFNNRMLQDVAYTIDFLSFVVISLLLLFLL